MTATTTEEIHLWQDTTSDPSDPRWIVSLDTADTSTTLATFADEDEAAHRAMAEAVRRALALVEIDEHGTRDVHLTRAQSIGHQIGSAIFADAVAENMPREWTGLDAQDGDRAMGYGLEIGTAEWAEMEGSARTAFCLCVETERELSA